MPIENSTNPSLYSFFHGLKNVLTRIGKESNCKNAVLREAKKESNP